MGWGKKFSSASPLSWDTITPLSSLFFSVSLASFSLANSTIAWAVLLLGCTAGLFVIFYRISFPRPSSFVFVLFLAVFLLSYPILLNFKWGQVSVLLVLLLLLALFAYGKGRWFLAAFLLATATSVKFYPGLFILPFLFRKDWRLVFAFAGWCAVFFVLIPLVALGPESSFSFLGQITELAFSKQRASRGSNSQFFPMS